MRYLSVCSGIEAATVAWHHMGWEPVAFSEIEKFPSAVLAHHYPSVPNWGDMTKFQEWPDANVDVLVGGTPCQSFSVAGLRKGLDDPRGNLMLTFGAIAQRYRPQWLVWENVPGVLSSNGGRDFGTFLGMLGELGYGFAYRVLDAQFFGVAQRRRRVFVVGHLGNWQRAAAVLFERHSLSGHPAPSRQARKGTAGSVAAGVDERGLQHTVGTLCADTHPGAYSGQDAYTGKLVPHTFKVRGGCEGGGKGYLGSEEAAFTVATTQDQWLAQPVATLPESLYNQGISQGDTNACSQKTNAGTLLRVLHDEIGEEVFAQWGLGILNSLQPPEVLQQALHGLSIRPATFSKRWVVYCSLSREESRAEGVLQSLREAGCQRCASQGWQPPEQFLGELGAYLSELSLPGTQATRFLHDLWQAAKGTGVLQQALLAIQNVGRPVSVQAQSAQSVMQVRRLTAEEAEFLQGFPRGYTNIPWRGKPESPDGPRYKALGNSMAVPCMVWIGERINEVSKL